MNPGTARRGGRSDQQSDSATKLGASCWLEWSQAGSAIHLVLVGELDLSCSKKFKESLSRIAAGSPEALLIDLRSVTFIDSTGIALLLKADSLAREEGFRLHIVRSRTEIVKAVFEASGVDRLLPVSDDMPDT